MNINSYIASSPRTVAFSNVNSGSVISVRTSDKTYRTIGSGPVVSGDHAVTSWNAYAVKKTASFTAIHKDVSGLQSTLVPQPKIHTEQPLGPKRSSSRPGVPTGGDGETPPATGQLVPVGDMLLPMLVIALGYIVVKLFRNRKTSQAL